MNTSFNDFNLPATLQETLERMGYMAPTPIQAQAIPAALDGRDVLGSAQTGTGKTGAFCIPMIAALINDPTKHALVMTPTRELATQVLNVARDMIGKSKNGKDNFIYTAQLIGGESMGKQFGQLRMNPRLIVGTPGRINDHLRQNPKLLSKFSFLVLDEADRMLDMGFSVQIDEVLSKMAKERQTLMFSATFPPSIVRFSQSYLNNPERVSVGEQSRAHANIEHKMKEVANENKYGELLSEIETREGTVIVFVKTKHGADKMADRLTKSGQEAVALHGGLRQGQRDRAIANFRKQNFRVLVATDVAARGLDVPHVEHVINYDMPQVAEDYIHRIGRTGRAGAKGEALAMVSPADKHLWRDVARLLNPDEALPEESSEERRFKGKKKPFGKKPFGKKPSDGGRFERKPYNPASEDYASEKKFGEKKFGAERRMNEKSGEKKPFQFNKFKKAENDNPVNRDGGQFERKEKSFKPRDGFAKDKPFKKREDGFVKKEGGFKKKEGSFQKRDDDFKPRDDFRKRDEGFKSEGGFKKPFKKREDGEFKPRDGFKKREDGFKSEGGFKKPFKKREDGEFKPRDGFKKREDGDFQKREGGFKKEGSFKKEGGFKKKDAGFAKKDGGFKKKEGTPFAKKSGGIKKRVGGTFSTGGSKPRHRAA